MYTVYVLSSTSHQKSYVGMTDNIERRLAEHNTGKSSYTKSFLPWKIIYTEIYNNRLEARRRERYLKSAAGRKFLARFF